MKFVSRAIVAVALLALAGGSAWADQIVYFKSGRVIVASKVEQKEGWIFLEFLGGGVMGVPSVKVDRIEETDLVSEAGTSVANTIQAPDGTRRSSGRNTPTGRPFRPEAAAGARNNPQGGAAVPGTIPGGNRLNRLNRGQQGQNPNQPGLRNSPQLQQQPDSQGPFGLRPIDLNGNANSPLKDPDSREDQQDEEDN